jgi:integrase
VLTVYRRHVANCQFYGEGEGKGRKAPLNKCSCPFWADGPLNGKDFRKSLKTRDQQRAIRNAERLERPRADRDDLMSCAHPGCSERVEHGRCQNHIRGVAAAVEAFHAANPDLAHGTKLKYKRTLRLFGQYATAAGVQTIDAITLEFLERFRASREVGLLTWLKELQILRLFLRYCGKHGWIFGNPAKEMPTPKGAKLAGDREPYSPNEVTKVLAACDTMGRTPYERLRARAMVLLLRHTALRISDVSVLRKDRIRGRRIFLRTAKNGKPVFLPVHPDLKAALDTLPAPRGFDGPNCPFFFWSGHGTTRSMIRDATRTLTAVFKESGVVNACAHRFRHTLATEVLELGGTIEQAADILGDSPEIVRKHYAKWSAGRQAQIDALMERLWQNPEVQRGYTEKPHTEVVSIQ